MFQDSMKLSGDLNIVLKDENGNVKDSRVEKNRVVDTGLEFIADRMIGNTPAVMSHMGIGTGTVGEAAGDTGITIAGSRVSITTIDQSAGSKTVKYVASFGPGEGLNGASVTAITEAGIFNALTDGIMLCRTTFPVVNKDVGDTLEISWTITLQAAV